MHTTRKLMNLFLGFLLLIVGVAGLVLPILNGTFFLIIGFILISFESKYVERKLHHFTKKNATAHKWHLYLEKLMRRFFKR